MDVWERGGMSTLEDKVRATHRFTLKFPWLDNGDQGVEEIKIHAQRPLGHYGRFRHQNRVCATSLADAKSTAFSARSRVAFMDASGLVQSVAANTVWALCGAAVWPAGFEFVYSWRCPLAKRLLVTTEPIGDRLRFVESECSARGWPYHVFPPGIGMRYPSGGSRLVLISPQGVDLGPVIAALERAMPRCEIA
jgi:hypothetical protein